MDELISRQAVINMKGLLEDWTGKEYEAVLIEDIERLPSVEPKRIRGKWVGADTQCGIACSVCGVAVDDFCHSADYIDLDYEPNFCPNCGSYNGGEINDQ